MSLRWTPEQLEEYRARQSAGQPKTKQPGYVPLLAHSREIGKQGVSKPDQGKESDLQAKIERFLTEKGWYFFHDRSRGANAKGQPDLVVALPGGRVVWLELKSAGGRLRPEQKQVRLMLMHLGHKWYEVRSYKQFLEIMNGESKS